MATFAFYGILRLLGNWFHRARDLPLRPHAYDALNDTHCVTHVVDFAAVSVHVVHSSTAFIVRQKAEASSHADTVESPRNESCIYG